MSENHELPKISVGLPVYDGERYLAEAIESILDQTYRNFELIISDNASTDRTGEICRRYADRDPRVRYVRQETNLGATGNFNRVFELAETSRYFKWAAHDDVMAPTFLEKCLTALEGNPDAVLCYPWVRQIDENGNEIEIKKSRLSGVDAKRLSDRFAAVVLKVTTCREIFGLIRSEELRKTTLHRSYEGEDKNLLAELALMGQFIEIDEPLFLHREHSQRFVYRIRSGGFSTEACLNWYDPKAGKKKMPYTWIQYFAYARAAHRHAPSMSELLRCYGHLVRWFGVKRKGRRVNLRNLAYQAMEIVSPRLPHFLRAVKRRLAHGH